MQVPLEISVICNTEAKQTVTKCSTLVDNNVSHRG